MAMTAMAETIMVTNVIMTSWLSVIISVTPKYNIIIQSRQRMARHEMTNENISGFLPIAILYLGNNNNSIS